MNNEDILIPIELITGEFRTNFAIFLLSYSRNKFFEIKGKYYMSLIDAIKWHEEEIKQTSDLYFRKFCIVMLKELKNSLISGEFQYTEEIINFWAKAYPDQYKKFSNIKNKKFQYIQNLLNNKLKSY